MFTIRQYKPFDHASVIELHEVVLKQVGAYSADRLVDADMERIEEVYVRNRGEFLVGEYEGRLIAMGALRHTFGDRGEIKRMRVHPDYQRRGFGQAILSALEKRAQELGYTELHLDTTVQQTGAQHFYAKNRYMLVREENLAEFKVLFYERNCEGPNLKTEELRPYWPALPKRSPSRSDLNPRQLIKNVNKRHLVSLPRGFAGR